MRAPRVPRPLVLIVAAAIVAFPAARSIADWYRLDGQGRVIHHHTDSYGLYNAVGTGDTALRDRINWARADWHGGTTKIDVPALPSLSGAEIWARRDNLGQNNVAVIWASPFHATPPTEVIFNSYHTNGWTNTQKRGRSCRVIGQILGLSPNTEAARDDCMEDPGTYTQPGPISLQLVDDYYGPNVAFSASSGSLYRDRNRAKADRRYRLIGDASGHALESVTVLLDDQQVEQETQVPCPAKCSLDVTWQVEVGDLTVGTHTVKVVAENEFGRTHTRQFEISVDPPDTGILRHFTFEDEALTDRSTWSTNVANGNGILEARDVEIAGTGLDLVVSRFWNSLTDRETSFGRGWSMGTGDGVELEELGGGDVRFFGPSGFVVRFGDPQTSGGETTYGDEPAGIDASLTKRTDGTWRLDLLRSEERMIFDEQGRLTRHVDRNDHELQFSYQSGRLTKITDTQDRELAISHYGAADPAREGLIREISDWTGRTWTYGYDTQRQLTSYTDPDGDLTEYLYDGQDRLWLTADPRPSGVGRTAIAYKPGNDRRVAAVTREADPQGEGPFRTSFAYDLAPGECRDEGNPDDEDERSEVTDPNDNTTTYCHDQRSQVSKVIDARGNEQDIGYTSKGNIETYALASGIEHRFTYDGANRLTRVNATGGAQTRITYYSGNESFRPNQIDEGTEDEPSQSQLVFFYDGSGNLSIVNDGIFTPHLLVRLEHNDGSQDSDLKGTLEWSEDGRGNRTEYEYDGEGNLIREIAPKAAGGATLIGDTEYGYGEPGSTEHLSRVTAVTDGNGREREISYDGIDRPEMIEYLPREHPSQPTNSVRYEYDGAGNLRERSDGRHNEGTSEVRDEFRYDGRNLRTEDLLRGSRTVRYSYDDAGNLTALEHVGPAGEGYGTTTYAYNAVNLVTAITEPGGAGSFSFNYNSDNQPTEITFPNGLVQTNEYGNERLIRSHVTQSGTTISDLRYRWDPDRTGDQSDPNATDLGSRLTRMHDLELGIRTDYTYDGLARLTRAQEVRTSGSEPARDYRYSFDLSSNVTEKRVDGQLEATYAYNNANQLTQASGDDYDYDLNGNLLEVENGNSYEYDRRNHAREITPDGASAIEFEYANGTQRERLRKDGIAYTSDLLGLGVENPASANPTFYTRNPDTGEVLGMRGPQGRFYFLSDQLGTIRAITNSSGTLLRRYRYEPYGASAGLVDPPGAPSAPQNPIRFQNQYLDSETGLYKMGMRYMDPEVGRWTQRDILNLVADPRQGNRYGFAGADPVNQTDPSGTQFSCEGVLPFGLACPDPPSPPPINCGTVADFYWASSYVAFAYAPVAAGTSGLVGGGAAVAIGVTGQAVSTIVRDASDAGVC